MTVPYYFYLLTYPEVGLMVIGRTEQFFPKITSQPNSSGRLNMYMRKRDENGTLRKPDLRSSWLFTGSKDHITALESKIKKHFKSYALNSFIEKPSETFPLSVFDDLWDNVERFKSPDVLRYEQPIDILHLPYNQLEADFKKRVEIFLKNNWSSTSYNYALSNFFKLIRKAKYVHRGSLFQFNLINTDKSQFDHALAYLFQVPGMDEAISLNDKNLEVDSKRFSQIFAPTFSISKYFPEKSSDSSAWYIERYLNNIVKNVLFNRCNILI